MISSIAIPSADRPNTALQSLESYRKALEPFGRKPSFVLIDDSRTEETQAAYRAGLTRFACETRVETHYASREDRRRYAERLAKAAGVDPAITRFALVGTNREICTTGSARNSAFLQHPGRSFFSADDDTLAPCWIRPWGNVSPTRTDKPVFIPPLPLADVQGVRDQLRVFDGDFLAFQERFLAQPSEERNNDRVAVTWMGILGDSGFSSSLFLLLPLPGRVRRVLTQSAQYYERALASRLILRAPPSPLIARVGLLQSTALAFGHGAKLPPFVPLSRGEDIVFSMILRKLAPGATAAYLPIGIHHRPPDHRCNSRALMWEHARACRPHEGLQAVLDLCEGNDQSLGVPDERAYRRLSGQIEDLLGDKPDTFARLLEQELSKRKQKMVSRVREHLAGSSDAPHYWKQDVRSVIEAMVDGLNRRTVTAFDELAPEDPQGGSGVRGFITLLKRYARLLAVWPHLLTTAAELEERETRLARRL